MPHRFQKSDDDCTASSHVGDFQEAKAEKAIEALAKMILTEATVRRGGEKLRIPSGRGEGMVFATGDLTEMGRIAGMMNLADDLQTPLTRKIAQFGQHPRHLLGQDRHAHAEGKSRPRLPLPQGDRTRSQGRSVGYLLMQETSVQRCCPSATLSGHPAGRYPIADCPSGHPAVGYPTADSLAACESHEV